MLWVAVEREGENASLKLINCMSEGVKGIGAVKRCLDQGLWSVVVDKLRVNYFNTQLSSL